ncbi:putative transporter [Zea mays]|uniref:Putative transporter n=1 Tax=Zea mays TaxID=4577 RepID=A0A3L6E9Y5_MAIZE|nr:putative transporter [Zea mays]
MFLPKHPSPTRPGRTCLQPGVPLVRPRSRIPATTLSERRHLLRLSAAASSSFPSRDSPLSAAKGSSQNKPPDEIRRWKAVSPGMRESADPETETEDPSPPRTALWSARRRARAAWRKVVSWVPRKARSLVLLNLVTLIFASNISVVKQAEALLDPDLFNMLRFTIAAIPFVPLLLKSLRNMQILFRGLELGIWVSVAYLAQAMGLVTAGAGRASFISALTVIIVPFLDGLIGAEVPAHTWFGAFLSLFGVIMLELSGSPPCVGDLLNLLSAFSFAIHMLRTEHISRNIKKENFLTLVGCEVAAMRVVSATETAIIYGLEPVWGAAFAWVMLGERWGLTGFVGAIFIMAGSLMVQIYGSILDDVSRGDDYQMNI